MIQQGLCVTDDEPGTAVAPAPVASAGDSPLILVVDDDDVMRMLAHEALGSAGFEVIEAESGEEATRVFRESRPDIVLLDVVMPEVDGFETCERIRGAPGGIHVPVVMMTGCDDVESIARAYDAGATDFITKPINYMILTQRVRYMLRAKLVADEFRENASLLASSERVARVGHWAWDPSSRSLRSSEQLELILGRPMPSEAVLHRDLCRQVHPDDRREVEQRIAQLLEDHERTSVEHRVLRDDGEVRIVHQEIEVLADADGKLGRVLGTMQDITERREAEQKIRYLAYYDAVTGLPNRTLFTDQLNHALTQAKRYERAAAVLFCDLDHFKRVNDTMGHSVGDELLCIVAARLRESIRDCDYVFRENANDPFDSHSVARLGGDEFVVLLGELREPDDAARVAARICESIAEPIEVGGSTVYVSCSVGISNFPADGDDVTTLLKHADAAMYHAKGEGRNQYKFYTKAVNARVLERMALENNLHSAIERGEMHVVYQPKVDTASGDVVSIEALLRWESAELGSIAPSRFIPIAEDSGLIVSIGAWVLRQACLQATEWRENGYGDLRMSVNLSPVQFKSDSLADDVARILEETGLPPSLLELELTESVLMDDVEASVEVLTTLTGIGVQVAIDDFGIGYSSLSHLTRFPVSALKIDYSFIRDMVNNGDDAAIVAATIALGHSLRLNVVAEGVEDVEQLEFLRAHECDESQGFLFSEPVQPERLARWMEDRKPGRGPA